jgi:AcrR family transcriptional regulator
LTRARDQWSERSRPSAARGRRVRLSAVESSAQGTERAAADREDASPEPARGARWNLVENQILTEATRLFAERGFAGTSLKDIADATGLTRPALYHYFANKEAVLARLVSELTLAPAAELAKLGHLPGKSAVERLHAMVFDTALRHARQPERYRVLLRSDAELPGEVGRSYRQGRRRILAEFVAVIEEGMTNDEMRPANARTAALGMVGMCVWVAWWYRPDSDDDERVVASAIADMAVASVTPADGRSTTASGPARALELLKQDVAFLEAALAREMQSPPSRG